MVGWGVQKDDRKAMKLSLYFIASMYLCGLGVEKNIAGAKGLFRISKSLSVSVLYGLFV